jgi:hypothetical protein
MKKPLLTLLGVLALFAVESSAQITDKTDFVGALSTDPAKDWTKTWTNWTPGATVYPDVTDITTFCAASGGVVTISSDMTLDASKVYLLQSIVSVESGATLTIPAGTIIRGEADVLGGNYACIIVCKGGKIVVNGTADKPVVMTSNYDGDRARGDWGGLALFGDAKNNLGTDVQMEGFNKITDYKSGLGGKHGGSNDNDNSGSISYLRLEFGGIALDVNKEINGLTFGSIGNATSIDHVQVSYANDDSYEWFGGTVNCKHLIAFGSTDDDFDTDNGYSGQVQYGIGYKVPDQFDLSWKAASGASTSEGFESDNDANGSANLPLTTAVFSNMTMVGPVKPGGTWSSLYVDPNDVVNDQKSAFRRGARIRRNSQQSILNSIFLGYRNFVMIDGSASIANAGVDAVPQIFNGTVQFQGNYISSTAAALTPSSLTADGLVEVATSGPLTELHTWISASDNANVINTGSYAAGDVLTELNDYSKLDFKPVVASPVNNMSRWTSAKVSVTGLNDVAFLNSEFAVYPNPSSGAVNVAFELVATSQVSIDVFALTGEKVATLHQGVLAKGKQLFSSASALNAGVYVVKVSSDNASASVKLVVE